MSARRLRSKALIGAGLLAAASVFLPQHHPDRITVWLQAYDAGALTAVGAYLAGKWMKRRRGAGR